MQIQWTREYAEDECQKDGIPEDRVDYEIGYNRDEVDDFEDIPNGWEPVDSRDAEEYDRYNEE